MNKLVIPTILAFTVLIAGAFAFVPVDKAATVEDEIIAALNGTIINMYDDVLLDLEEKIKLSSASAGPTNTSGSDNLTVDITIRALDNTGLKTTFNLKECYLKGEGNDGISDEVRVTAIRIDGEPLFTSENKNFSAFGPIDSSLFGMAMVELLSGLENLHTGLGADDTITMTVTLDTGERVNEIKCVAFVQNSADLDVNIELTPQD